MRTRHTVAFLAASLVLVAAACSSSATPPIIYLTPSPGQSTPPSATATDQGQLSATSTATATPAPTAAPTATPTKTPVVANSFAIFSFGIVSMGPYNFGGAYLLYQLDAPKPSNAFQPQVWVVKPDGTGNKNIANGTTVGPLSPPNYNIDAVWAGDGAPVHVTRGCVSKLSDIAVGSWAESPKVTMTDKDQGFLWSPDDKKVVYWHFTSADFICEQNGSDNAARDLMVMNVDGSNKKVLVHNFDFDSVAVGWTPDSSMVMVHRNSGTWQVVNATSGATSPLGLTADAAEFSPDGTRLAYLHNGHVWVRPTGGGNVTDLGAGTEFAWRPDSKAVAVASGTLKIVPVSGMPVLTIYNFSTQSLSWSPDGKKLAFIKKAGGGIFVIPAAGGTLVAIPNTTKAYRVTWQP